MKTSRLYQYSNVQVIRYTRIFNITLIKISEVQAGYKTNAKDL